MDSKEWTIGSILELSGYYWKTCTLHTGVKLDIFSVLSQAPLSALEVAKRINGDVRGVSALLNALTALGLIDHKNGLYSNTDSSERYLSKTSQEYIGFMIMHHHNLLDSWGKIDQAVLSGKPVRERSSKVSEEQRENFLMGMFNIAMATAPDVSEILDLSDCDNLLDLGGGPGTFAIHFCLKNPGLTAKVYDLPTTRPFAVKTIKRFDLSHRIEFIEGDFLEENFLYKNQFHAVWLSHILHGEGPTDAESIVEKAVSALKPGGKIFIHEFILKNTMDGPLFPALFAINMLVGTEKGQSYSEEQLFEMLEKNNVQNISRLDFSGPNQSGIIAGTKFG